MKPLHAAWMCLVLAACARQEEQRAHIPSDLPQLAVSQAWGVMEQQGLATPDSARIHKERVVAEFNQALGVRSRLAFRSRQDFEGAVQGERFAELDGVVSDLGNSQTTRWRVYSAWISAVGRSFDPNATFYPPTRQDAVLGLVSGHGEGVGVDLLPKQGGAAVGRVATGSPARAAGLPVGAKIIGVEEKGLAEIDVSGASVEEVQEMLKGRPGSEVMVRVASPAGLQKVSLVRQAWAKEEGRVRSQRLRGLNVVAVPAFYASTTSSTSSDFMRAIAALAGAPYVLDLRSNAGGVLDQAAEIASLAGAKGSLWTVSSRRARLPILGRDALAPLPMAVWVNQDTGAAAEAIVAALQSRGVPVVGRSTAGKKTMQLMVPLDRESFLHRGASETGTLLLTTARLEWGKDGQGILPDCTVAVAKASDKQYSNATRACILESQ